MKPLRQVTKRYRQILIASLMSSGSLLPLLPALADPLLSTAPQNSAAPGVIENQATAEFTDSADGLLGDVVSDIVKVTVAEIAGISATGVGINSATVGTAPTLYPTSTAYFDFVVKNEGNDPTQLFVPAAPSVATVNGTAVVAGQLQVINYNTIAPGTGTVTTTAVTTGNLVNTTTGSATSSLTGLPNGGSLPAGGYITVRVPITIPFGTPNGAPIVVTLGNTPTAPTVAVPVNNMPYVASGVTTGNNDLFTQDNTTVSAVTGETNITVPFNGEREASATQTVNAIVPKVVISGKVYDDANNTALNTFSNIQDGTESGAVVPNPAPVYALLVDNTGKVIGNSIVKNDGTNGVGGTNGTYTFSVDGFQNGLTVVLSSSNVVVGTIITAATPSLPTGWTGTSPLTYTAFNVTDNSTPALIASYTGKDFGIELLPTAVGFTVASQINPTGVNNFTVPATVFTSSTDSDGTVASYKITAFPSNVTTITINGTTYTATTFAAAVTANGGVTFTLAQLNAGAVTIDPIDGASTVNILFQAIDNAGKLSLNTATGSLPFSAAAITVSGTVINDKDQSAVGFTNIKTGTEGGTDTLFGTNGTSIYATLYNLDTNKVIATQVIPSTGIYSFPGVTATTNVKVILSTTAGTSGSATAPTPGLPAGWVGTTVQDSGTFNTGLFDVANKDFGVIQKAKFVIVKRITKIGKTATTMSATNPNDSTSLAGTSTDSFNFNATKNPTVPGYVGNWPANYIVGTTDAGKVVPGDFIEYTIYFMNNQGADAKNVKICDPIRGSQNYVPSSVSLNLTSDPSLVGTAIADTASRLNVFTGNAVPANCNMGAATSTGTNNGGVAIDITGSPATTDQPVGVPGATGVGTANTYGMFRFRTQVKP